MSGTYGQAGVTYGGVGTYGDWGSVTAPVGGGRTSPWLSFPTVPDPPKPGAGHLHVDFTLSGEGSIRSGHVLFLDGDGRIIDPHETELLALVLDLPELFE